MIHLAITKSHLLCAQWIKRDKQNVLTALSSKSLNEPLLNSNPAKHIVSNIDSALQHIRKDIAFDGDKVFVSIPDSFCSHVLIDLDDDMTEHDGWDYSKWIINQRWPLDGEFEYFGRYFRQERKVFVLRLARAFADPLKVAIQQLGSETFWMGTESSAFFGLNPEKGSTVIYPKKTDYKYFTYTPNAFLNGSLRYSKNSWKVINENGSSYLKDIFQGQVLILGELTQRKKKHFGSKRITQLSALSGFILEGVAFPKNLDPEDQEKLHVLAPIANGQLPGVVINFFDGPGFQPYTFGNGGSEKLKKAISEPVKVNKKNSVETKKSRSFLKNTFLFLFFVSIGGVVLQREAPELVDKILGQSKGKFDFLNNINISNNNFVQKFSDKFLSLIRLDDKDSDSLDNSIDSKELSPVSDSSKYLSKSLSLASNALKTLESFSSISIQKFSVYDDMLSIDFIYSKNVDSLIAPLGEVVNYSLRQINGDSLYRHGYLLKYDLMQFDISSIEVNKALLEEVLINYNSPVLKSLDQIIEKDYLITPIILKIQNINEAIKFMNYIIETGNNIALDKFEYLFNNKTKKESAIFFISIYSRLY